MRAFLFAPESPRIAALMRIALGGILLWDALHQWRYAVELYSSFGPAMPVFPGTWLSPPVPNAAGAVVLHSVLLFSLAAATSGWRTRTSLIVAFVADAWTGLLDAPGTFAKDSVVGLHLLFLLAFSRCGEIWSVDGRREHGSGLACPLQAVWPRRLMQLLVCSIYLGAAVTKLKSPQFVNGDILTFSLLDGDWGGGWFGQWLTTLPHMPMILSLLSLTIELLFPFLIWNSRFRRVLLLTATLMHVGMAVALHLGTFSPLMLTALLAFVTEADLAAICRGYLRREEQVLQEYSAADSAESTPVAASRSCSVVRSLVAYVLCGSAVVAGSFAIQQQADWYGAFGKRKFEAPPAVDDELYADIAAAHQPAIEDYIHRIDVAHRVGGNQAFGNARRFRTGERLYVLIQMIQPHPSIHLEGLLIAPDGREAARFTHKLAEGFAYAVDGIEFTNELPTGDYRLIIQADGYEVAQRRFELLP